MSRDHRKLKVFQLADELVLQVYRVGRRLAMLDTEAALDEQPDGR